MRWEFPGIRQAEPVGEGLTSEAPGTGEYDVRGSGLSGVGGSLNVYGCVWAMSGS